MTTASELDIIETINHPALFRRWFKNQQSFAAWKSFLRAMFALPMSEEELVIYAQCTGRTTPPTEEVDEAALIVGRRGGKSLILALIAVYLAVFREWRDFLVPGERGAILVLATDKKQARVIFRYARALIKETPALAVLIEREDAETLDLTNGLTIEVQSATFRSVRGHTIIAALLDEIAFWRNDDSANPDDEIVAAIRPAQVTIPHAKLLLASSPYARRGVLYESYREHYAKGGPVLIWKAPTRQMNPSVSLKIIEDAYAKDPASAAAEYGAEFRSDIESFVDRSVLDAATVPGRHELPYLAGAAHGYFAFIDAAGGSGQDSMTIGISHREGDVGILDAIRERRPPFSPDDVVTEFCNLMKAYGVNRAESDKWGGDWVGEAFRKQGITVEPCAKPKSDLYRELLPLLNSGKAELLDLPRLHTQLASLERRTARGGRDSIDRPPGAHDDLANAAAGSLVMAIGGQASLWVWERLGDPWVNAPIGMN